MMDLDYEELNKELEDRAEILSNNAKRIVERFRYRTMVNRSYNLKEANEIEMKIEAKLEKISEEISELWSLIG